MFRKVQEGSRRFKKVQEGTIRFKKVQDGSCSKKFQWLQDVSISSRKGLEGSRRL